MNSIPLAGQVAAPTPLYMWNQRPLHSPALLELLLLHACSLHSDVELCRLCFGHGSHGIETALLRRGQHRAWPTHLALRTSFLSLNGHVMFNCLTVIHQRTLMLPTIIESLTIHPLLLFVAMLARATWRSWFDTEAMTPTPAESLVAKHLRQMQPLF